MLCSNVVGLQGDPSDARLEQAWQLGQEANPTVELELTDFAAFVRERPAAWAELVHHASDLYLACACARSVPRAAERFVERFAARLPTYLGRQTRGPDFVAEVWQELAVRALVGVGARGPEIADYSGRGSLEGWVRIAAVRIALMAQRGAGRRSSWEQAVEERVVDHDVELGLLKYAYREPFGRAFRSAVARLEGQARLLLRLHYVESMTTAQLAVALQVSRATVIRRLADARAALMAMVREEVRATAGIDDAEFDSLLRLIQSQLDLSLSQLLRDTGP
jgi:RNA polymerase sigma-70 factor (ECF subfamily)